MELVGHEEALSLIKKFHEQEKKADAFLFCGPSGVGKRKAAKLLAISRLCGKGELLSPCGACKSCERAFKGNHPGLIEVSAEGLSIKRGKLLEVLEEFRFKPYTGSRRFLIIDEAENLTEKSANLLLKTIEEPPEGVYIILITSRVARILPTIRSRCKHVYFGLLSREEVTKVFELEGFPPEELFITLADGSPGLGIKLMKEFAEEVNLFNEINSLLSAPSIEKALHLSETLGRKRERIVDVLEMLKHWISRTFLSYPPLKVASLIERVDIALREIKLNANISLSITKLLIDLGRISISQ